jgi:hypothetical protein
VDCGGASGTAELLGVDVGVTGAEEKTEEEPEGEMVAVPLIDVSGVLEGVGVLDPLVEELEEVGSST